MGNVCEGTQKKSKKRGGSLIKIKNQNDNCYYKPKYNTSSLICYDPEKKTLKEEIIECKSIFRVGCMFSKLGPCLYLCIGGVESSDLAIMIHLTEKKATALPPPPCCLAYGHLNKYKDKIFVVGALILDSQGCNIPAPTYCFDLKSKRWTELPSMPYQVSLCGSYIVHTYLYIIGGFINYPNSPIPFKSLLIFDISAECWVESDMETPIAHGLPNCTTLPSSDILIIGGHDPIDFISEKSKNVYLFDGKIFEKCADLPEVGSLKFFEDAMSFRSEIYIYSEDGILFIYNIDKDSWSTHEFEENLSR